MPAAGFEGVDSANYKNATLFQRPKLGLSSPMRVPLPTPNQAVARFIDGLTAVLLIAVLGPGGWEANKLLSEAGVPLPPPSVNLVLVSLLGLLPRLMSGGWDGYLKLWHLCRLLIAWLLFALLYPFNFWQRWGSRLTSLWAALSVLAIFAATEVADLRRDRPLVEALVVQLVDFLNEHPRMDAPAQQQVESLLSRYDQVHSSADEMYPRLRAFIQNLRFLYIDKSGTFESRALGVIAQQSDAYPRKGKRTLDDLLGDLLLIRLHLYLSKQGGVPEQVQSAVLALEEIQAHSWLKSDSAFFQRAYAPLRELQENSIALTNFYCARNYSEYEGWSRKYSRRIASREDLLADAEGRLERAFKGTETSRVGRIRALNNSIGIVFERLKPQLDPLDSSLKPEEEARRLLKVESQLLAQRDTLESVIRETPRANVMVTMASVDLLLAHVNAEISDNLVARRRKLPSERTSRVSEHLRSVVEDISMALRFGFEPLKFERNPHALDLCRLLSFNLQEGYSSKVVRDRFLEAQGQALDMLARSGIKFYCPVCHEEKEVAGVADEEVVPSQVEP